MIREKDLQELRPKVQCKDIHDFTLQTIQATLNETAQQQNIPLSIKMEQVKCGGLFGDKDDCLIVCHPEHLKDYFSIVIRIKMQGKHAFIFTDGYGESKLMKADAVRKSVLSTAKVGLQRAADPHKDYNVLNDAASGAAFIGAGIVGVRHLIKGKSDKEKLEAEQQWYSSILDILSEIIS